jgi:transposase
MGQAGTAFAQNQKPWPSLGRQPPCARRHSLGAQNWSALAGFTQGISQFQHLLAALAPVGRTRRVAQNLAAIPQRVGPTRQVGLERIISGWQLRSGKKRGECVGKTKRGKGTKWMVVVDGQGVPLGSQLVSASPGEVTLAESTLARIAVPRAGRGRPQQRPLRVIADRGYDSDPLRWRLLQRGILLICPHRRGRRKPSLNDGRTLRRYRNRWKIERTFAWLGNFRRLLVRYDHQITLYRGFFHLACLIITLRHL